LSIANHDRTVSQAPRRDEGNIQMTDAAPAIYSRQVEPLRLGILGRATALVIGLMCLTVLMIALELRPSPTGVGTHTRLGFQHCAFLDRTGLPCPSCGMTTSFAWFARGNLLASVYVQPMGFVLAVLTAGGAWAGFYVAFTGKPAHRLLRLLPAQYYLFALFGLAIAAWGWKMFLQLKGIDGWQ
jgi:hypothetical protein